MKKVLLAIVAIAMTGISQAQTPIKRYDVTYSSGATYTPLTPLNGGTDIGFTGDWIDTVSNAITMPFTFKYQNTTVNNVAIESYGSLYLNSVISEEIAIGHITGINLLYSGKGRGKVIYSTTGAPGNRIFKVEYQNVGRALDDSNNDTLNFQIWLYEQNNAIEYRAGYSNVHDTMFAHTGAEAFGGEKEAILCGLMCHPGDSIGLNENQLFIHSTKYNGDISVFSDTAVTLNELGINNPIPNLNAAEAILYGSYPVSGSVIRFVPAGTTGISKVDFDMASIYPNPSKDGLFSLKLKEAPKADATLTIYDMTGKVVLHQVLNQAKATIDLAAYANGHYFGKLSNGGRTGSFKLIKE